MEENRSREYSRSIVLGKKTDVGFEGVQRGLLLERKGKVIPHRGAEDGKVQEPTVERTSSFYKENINSNTAQAQVNTNAPIADFD